MVERLEDLLERKKILLEALKLVEKDILICSAEIFNKIYNVKLSTRQKEVLALIQQEHLSNKEIGARLNITERTAKFHVSKILRKFGIAHRADLSW